MPYLLEDLEVNRVDFVDDGANSAAFIEIFKRKETNMELKEILAELKPEHATVITKSIEAAAAKTTADAAALATATEELKKANEKIAALEAEYAAQEKAKDSAAFDEDEVIKGMPKVAQELFRTLAVQKELAEVELKKAKEAEANSVAIAKASTLKALPVKMDDLVKVLKASSTETIAMFEAINAAIESTVLSSVGKDAGASSNLTNDAWGRIEVKAAEIAKRDSITKESAISKAITECPELYSEYLKGGAN